MKKYFFGAVFLLVGFCVGGISAMDKDGGKGNEFRDEINKMLKEKYKKKEKSNKEKEKELLKLLSESFDIEYDEIAENTEKSDFDDQPTFTSFSDDVLDDEDAVQYTCINCPKKFENDDFIKVAPCCGHSMICYKCSDDINFLAKALEGMQCLFCKSWFGFRQCEDMTLKECLEKFKKGSYKKLQKKSLSSSLSCDVCKKIIKGNKSTSFTHLSEAMNMCDSCRTKNTNKEKKSKINLKPVSQKNVLKRMEKFFNKPDLFVLGNELTLGQGFENILDVLAFLQAMVMVIGQTPFGKHDIIVKYSSVLVDLISKAELYISEMSDVEIGHTGSSARAAIAFVEKHPVSNKKEYFVFFKKFLTAFKADVERKLREKKYNSVQERESLKKDLAGIADFFKKYGPKE